MKELSPQAQMRLNQMKQRYAATLSDKLTDIETAWSACQGNGWAIEERNQLMLLVHKLAGSAGLYGFDELGEAARNMDVLLQEYDQISDPQEQLSTQLARLMSACAQAQA